MNQEVKAPGRRDVTIIEGNLVNFAQMFTFKDELIRCLWCVSSQITFLAVTDLISLLWPGNVMSAETYLVGGAGQPRAGDSISNTDIYL